MAKLKKTNPTANVMPPIEDDDRHCVVMFSGGISSYAAGVRALERYGKERTTFLFADTNMEDDDLYRFNKDVERHLGIELTVLDNDGKSVWDIFFEQRMMGSSRFDPCSRVLKRERMDAWRAENHPDPDKVVIVIGMDNEEDCHRIAKVQRAFQPYYVWFPLHDDPYVSKKKQLKDLAKIGIATPRLYDLGFKHNNCGGFCVKAGYGHFHHLLLTMPERFKYHEEMEQKFRREINDSPGATIMRYRSTKMQGSKKGGPMTMKEFRERVESGERFVNNARAGFACACMAAEPAHGKGAGISFDKIYSQADLDIHGENLDDDGLDPSGFELDTFE
tara:strand:+ start:25153 stop:26151 length:999 start_codon:yes stop_codon:yes gene_type:complete